MADARPDFRHAGAARRRRRVMLGAIGIAYILLVMVGRWADWLILFPSTAPLDARGAQRRVLPFEGGQLELWTSRSPETSDREPQAYVLAFVGNGDRAERHAWDTSDWKDKPVEVWALNPPGYGASTGPARLDRLPQAALAAYDAVAARAQGKPIFVTGVSLGTTSALYVAAHHPVAGLVLRSPPPLRSLILGRHGWWNLWLAAGPIALGVPGELDSLKTARHATAPAVFLITGSDDLVPAGYQQKVVDAYAGPKQLLILTGFAHNTPLQGPFRLDYQAHLDRLWQTAIAPPIKQ